MAGGYLERPEPSGLADVVEVLLARGVVVDAYLRVGLLGIELLTVDARVVIASVDTYLRFAEATNRLEVEQHRGRGVTELATELGGAAVERAAANVVEKKLEPVAKPVRRVVETVRDGVEKIEEVVEGAAGAGEVDR